MTKSVGFAIFSVKKMILSSEKTYLSTEKMVLSSEKIDLSPEKMIFSPKKTYLSSEKMVLSSEKTYFSVKEMIFSPEKIPALVKETVFLTKAVPESGHGEAEKPNFSRGWIASGEHPMAGRPFDSHYGGMQNGRCSLDIKPPAAARLAPADLFSNPVEISNRRLAERLADSNVFREFQQVFEAATGLPLTLRSVESWKLAHTDSRNQNGFCALMSHANSSCSACLQLQQRVCDGVNGVPCTLSCSFGLRETAVGVKIGKEIVVYLQTGQVFFKPPTPGQTKRALKQIKEWGLDINRGEAAKRYLATPVVRQAEYEARIKLLQFFGGHLGALANQISFEHKNSEPPQVTQARKFIEEQYREKISLTKMAGLVNINKFHFCRIFKEATGANFTDYVNRFRVEKAKNLLMNIHYRISEIGFEVGFQSLAHFNRSFRGVAGESPTEYRLHLPSV